MLREPVRVLDKGSGGGKTADKVSTGLRHVERKLGAGHPIPEIRKNADLIASTPTRGSPQAPGQRPEASPLDQEGSGVVSAPIGQETTQQCKQQDSCPLL